MTAGTLAEGTLQSNTEMSGMMSEMSGTGWATDATQGDCSSIPTLCDNCGQFEFCCSDFSQSGCSASDWSDANCENAQGCCAWSHCNTGTETGNGASGTATGHDAESATGAAQGGSQQATGGDGASGAGTDQGSEAQQGGGGTQQETSETEGEAVEPSPSSTSEGNCSSMPTLCYNCTQFEFCCSDWDQSGCGGNLMNCENVQNIWGCCAWSHCTGTGTGTESWGSAASTSDTNGPMSSPNGDADSGTEAGSDVGSATV